MNNKKILILYATAGAGHKKAAEAIFHIAKSEFSQVKLIDIIDYMPKPAAKLYSDGYAFAITRLSWLWGWIYFLADTHFLSLINVHLRKFLDAILCKKLIKFLLEEQPDAVISTHFLASEIVSYVKEKFNLKTKLITSITDFGVHNLWLAPKTDFYCCIADTTKQILIKKGVPEDKIKVTGIPLHEKFLKIQAKEALSKEFNLNKKLFTVLIVTGGIGAGPIEEIVEALKGNAQILVVCGYNKKLYNRLSEKKYVNVHLFGFVDYIEKLMCLSDIILTKAGGLTIAEALSLHLPMIFFYMIPGQERINAETISRNNAGVITKNPSKIKELILKFRDDSDCLASYKNQTLTLAKPHASSEIISLIN